MNRVLSVSFVLAMVGGIAVAEEAPAKPNTLTAKQISKGWILLFDGETPFGWKIKGEHAIADGALRITEAAETTSEFGLFEIQFEYRGKGGKLMTYGNEDGFPASPDEWKPLHFKLPRASDAAKPKRTTIKFAAAGEMFLRNVRLKPLDLKSIFNGKDLTGWKAIPDRPSVFSVTEKGELNVKNGGGDLQSEGQWADFVLQLDIISNGTHLNSGVFFRAIPGEYWQGYESQIRNQWEGDDRTKPVDTGTGGLYSLQAARKVVSNDREWFTKTIAVSGKHLAVWVNGYQVSDHIDTRPMDRTARKGCRTEKGCISFQGHDPTSDLSFRNIRIAEIGQ